jgi:hypothetical protein
MAKKRHRTGGTKEAHGGDEVTLPTMMDKS